MRQQPIVRMANLDDEMSLSVEEEDLDIENDENNACGSDPGTFIAATKEKCAKLNGDINMLQKSGSLEALGFCQSDLLPGTSTSKFL